MKLTYNNAYVGDVLLVSLKSSRSPSYTHHDSVTVIKENDEVIGLNIFNASDKFELEKDVVNVTPTETHIEKVNEILTTAGEEKIEADLSPSLSSDTSLKNHNTLMRISSMCVRWTSEMTI